MGRIVGLAERDEAGTDPFGGGDLPLGLFAAADAQRPCRAAATRQIRQRRERGPGATAMIDEGAESARPDILAADEAQPVEPLAVAQTYRFTVRHERSSPAVAAVWRFEAGAATGSAGVSGWGRHCGAGS